MLTIRITLAAFLMTLSTVQPSAAEPGELGLQRLSEGSILSHDWSRGMGAEMAPFAWGLSVESGSPVIASADYPAARIVRYTPDGTLMWDKRIPMNFSSNDVYSVAHDFAGDIFLSGIFDQPIDLGDGVLVPELREILVAKLDGDGEFLWSRSAGSPQNDRVIRIAVDGAGDLLLIGTCGDSADFGGGPILTGSSENIFVAKYSGEGQHLWSRSFGVSDGFGIGVAVDPAGNVVAVGTFSGTVDFGGGPLSSLADGDIFVVKLDSDGDHLWSKNYGSDQGGGSGWMVAVENATGSLLIAGIYTGDVDFGGGPLNGGSGSFMVKLAADGSHVWSRSLGEEVFPSDLTLTNGGIAVTGRYTAPVDLGGGMLPHQGGQDMFLALFNRQGHHIYSLGAGTPANEVSRAVAADADGGIFISGEFGKEPLDLGGGPLSQPGRWDTFVAKYSFCPRELVLDIKPGSCPNPLNVKQRGVLPVALLGAADFDVDEIDVASLTLEGVPPLRGKTKDVASPDAGDGCECTTAGSDGFADLSLKFSAPEIVAALDPQPGETERMLTLSGTLRDGTPFVASDCVTFRPSGFRPPRAFRDGSGLRLRVERMGSSHRVAFDLLETSDVTLSVYSVTGGLVDRIRGSGMSAGSHAIDWDGADRPSGVYFFRVEAGRQTASRRAVIVN